MWQVSYAAMSPALSDRETYPSFFRLAAADASHNTARKTLIQHFRWNTVAAIHQDDEEHSLVRLAIQNQACVCTKQHFLCILQR